MTTSSKSVATSIHSTAAALGWSVSVREDVLTISKTIAKNDGKAFAAADNQYDAILMLAPTTRPGSVWGTDGSGMGALSAMSRGVFTMNKSGVSKRVLNALVRMSKS